MECRRPKLIRIKRGHRKDVVVSRQVQAYDLISRRETLGKPGVVAGFVEKNSDLELNYHEYVAVGCGVCRKCRARRQQEWVTRIMTEIDGRRKKFGYKSIEGKSMKMELSFSNDNLPETMGQCKEEVQKFVKRLRKFLSTLGNPPKIGIKYLAVGEYGENTKRIHAHIIIIGYEPDDLIYYKTPSSGFPLYNSEIISRIWGKGWVTIQTDLTPKAIKYVTLYATASVVSGKRYDREDNPELFAYIEKMNKGLVPEDKQIRRTYKLIQSSQFNLFSQNMGFEYFDEDERSMMSVDETYLGRKIPNSWYRKLLIRYYDESRMREQIALELGESADLLSISQRMSEFSRYRKKLTTESEILRAKTRVANALYILKKQRTEFIELTRSIQNLYRENRIFKYMRKTTEQKILTRGHFPRIFSEFKNVGVYLFETKTRYDFEGFFNWMVHRYRPKDPLKTLQADFQYKSHLASKFF